MSGDLDAWIRAIDGDPRLTVGEDMAWQAGYRAAINDPKVVSVEALLVGLRGLISSWPNQPDGSLVYGEVSDQWGVTIAGLLHIVRLIGTDDEADCHFDHPHDGPHESVAEQGQ